MATKTNGKHAGAIVAEVEQLSALERIRFFRRLFHNAKVRKELEAISFEEAIQRARKRVAKGEFVRLEDLNRQLD